MTASKLVFMGANPAIEVEQFVVREGLNALFEVTVWASSLNSSLNIDALVGRRAALGSAIGLDGTSVASKRRWAGVCRFAVQSYAARPAKTGDPERSHYEFSLVPDLWRLGMRHNYRVFQHKTVIQLIDALLDEWQIERRWQLARDHDQPLAYCVQYGETDLDFVERILQQSGISYFFADDEVHGSVLIFSDHTELAPLRPGPPICCVGVGTVAKCESIGNMKVSTDSTHAGRVRLSFTTNIADLTPGSVFTIEPQHPLLPTDKLLMVELASESRRGGPCTLSGVAVPADQPLRPVLRTPRPVVSGPQSATVVGPEGETIHTDEQGRVRVRFAWDRTSTKYDQGSCWLRVNQGWAGTGYGMLALPRVGQEVLVGFVGGNPDEPVVLGGVFNAVNTTPYKLPKRRLVSGIKTRLSPAAGGFNEWSYDDTLAQEELLLRAQRNLRMLVKRDAYATVGNDRRVWDKGNTLVTVAGLKSERVCGDRVELSSGDRRALISQDCGIQVNGDNVERSGKSQRIAIKGSREQLVGEQQRRQFDMRCDTVSQGTRVQAIEGNHSQIIEGNVHHSVDGHFAMQVQADIQLSSALRLIAEAKDVTFKAGGSFLRIDSTGVTVRGPLILINSGGEPAASLAATPRPPKKPGVGVLDPPSAELEVIRAQAHKRGLPLPLVRSWPKPDSVEVVGPAVGPSATTKQSPESQ